MKLSKGAGVAGDDPPTLKLGIQILIIEREFKERRTTFRYPSFLFPSGVGHSDHYIGNLIHEVEVSS